MPRVVGVDGCKRGWVCAEQDTATGAVIVAVLPTFQQVLALDATTVCVDIPIGLPAEAATGGRTCDRAARALLGPVRGTSVFSAPVHGVLGASTHAQASQLQRSTSAAQIGFTLQAWGIVPKIREVDRLMTPALQSRVFEVHPELSFFEMNGGTPVLSRKKSADGRHERLALLMREHLHPHAFLGRSRPAGCSDDDVIDAFAALWSARRVSGGVAVQLPSDPPTSIHGLRMAIWR